MSENYYNNYYWQGNFYHQYMQQHAAMMQWIQNLHSNIDIQGTNFYQHDSHSPHTRYENKPTECCSPTGSTVTTSENYSSDTYSSPDSEVKDSESQEIYEEEDESDYEYEFNVDAILAMRKAKEELKKEDTSSDDSSSIVMIGNDKEEFEFVELGSIQQEGAKKSILVGGARDRNAELQYEKELKENLYGEKCSTIAGLETAMLLTYERLCDIHQPPMWPVYPLRLSTSHI